MAPAIPVLNAGSSSLKFALYRGADQNILRGQVEGVGETPSASIRASRLRRLDPPNFAGSSYEDVLETLLQ